MREFPKNKVVEIWEIEPNLYQLLHQTRLQLEEILSALAEEHTTSMQSLFAKNKRTRQMLSRVCSKFLLLMFMLC